MLVKQSLGCADRVGIDVDRYDFLGSQSCGGKGMKAGTTADVEEAGSGNPVRGHELLQTTLRLRNGLIIDVGEIVDPIFAELEMGVESFQARIAHRFLATP